MADKKYTDERKSGSEVTLDLADDILGRLPDDFDLDEIGRIDLREAESIASEGALFLTEEDLLHELEDFDVIPLREGPAEQEPERSSPAAGREEKVYRKDEGPEREVSVTDIPIEIVSSEEETAGERAEVPEDKPGTAETAETREEPFSGQKPVSGDEDEIWINLTGEDVSVVRTEPFPPGKDAGDLEYLDPVDLVPAVEVEDAAASLEGESADTEYIDETETSFTDQAVRDAVFEDESDLEEYDELIADMDAEPENEEEDGFTILIDEIEENVPEEDYAADFDESAPVEYEVIPDDIQAVERAGDNVVFIDDGRVDKSIEERGTILEEAELERLTSDLAVVDEGKSVLLAEADFEEDREQVADIADEYSMTYDDLWLEFDEDITYQDDELDFIHTSIIEEDYSRYMREIDEYDRPRGESTEGRALEVLGLNVSDMDTIEDQLFADEYRDVELEDIFDIFYREPGYRDRERAGDKDCTYLVPRSDSLLDNEKGSIENDLSSHSALIFEEDVEDIRANLMEMAGKERALSVEIIDEVHDITDRVVIIEDDVDVDRFVKEFPEEKQHDIKKLMKYFDGLFEKLPEKTIRNFANSDYFDLYTKVMHDLDGYGTSRKGA